MGRSLVSIIVICLLGICDLAASNKYTVIKGYVGGKYRPSEIQLFTVKNGVPVKYAGTSIASNGTFAFMFQPEQNGFYYLFDGTDYYRFYTKGSDDIDVLLSDGNLQFEESVSIENQLLEYWQEQIEMLTGKIDMDNYGKYFVEFDSLQQIAYSWLEQQSDIKGYFKDKLLQVVQLDLLNHFINYISKYQQKYNSDEQKSDYYQKIIKCFPLQDASLLEQPYGIDLMNKYFSYKSIFVVRDREYPLEERLEEITSPLLKAEYVINQVDVSNFAHFCAYERKYFPLLQTEEQRYRFQHLQNRPFSLMQKGELAPNFIYQDTSGIYKTVADFSGKYKYVDIWATWCAPCKKEIPYLQELERKFADKGIVFVSISIDNDKKKWKKFVRENHLGGIQLWAGDWDNLPQELGIGSVPRFMLIDKEGNWIDANALRPSNPLLVEILEKLLR